MSIRTRLGKLERTAEVSGMELSPTFLTNASGRVIAAELPQLGLQRVFRFDGESEPDFRQRVHLELVKARSERTGPFYELLDTPTLEACQKASEAEIAKHDPTLPAKLKEKGELSA